MRYAYFGLLTLALCAPAVVLGDNVVLGTDYLAVQSGTHLDLAPFGTIDFKEVPIGPGNTSLIYERLLDAPIGGGQSPIQVTAVSLENVAPVSFGGSFFDVFVTLDPAHLARDTGTVDITGSLAGGSFGSSMDIWVFAHAVKVGDPSVTKDFVREVSLNNPGATWAPAPPPGAVIVPGPNDGSALDQQANLHSGLGPTEVDFFATSMYGLDFSGSGGGTGEVMVSSASVPEPPTLALMGLGLLAGMGFGKRRKLS